MRRFEAAEVLTMLSPREQRETGDFGLGRDRVLASRDAIFRTSRAACNRGGLRYGAAAGSPAGPIEIVRS